MSEEETKESTPTVTKQSIIPNIGECTMNAPEADTPETTTVFGAGCITPDSKCKSCPPEDRKPMVEAIFEPTAREQLAIPDPEEPLSEDTAVVLYWPRDHEGCVCIHVTSSMENVEKRMGPWVERTPLMVAEITLPGELVELLKRYGSIYLTGDYTG